MTREKNEIVEFDFSSEAIKRSAFRQAVEHPSVLYPGALGLLGLAASFLIGPGLLTIAAAGGGIAAAATAWAVNYGFRREGFAKAHISRLMQEMERKRVEHVTSLQTVLDELGSVQGRSQFQRLSEKFSTFQKMLDGKLRPGELTHARYLGMVEQVYLSALDNLGHVVNALRSVAAIDIDYIERRLATLYKQKTREQGDEVAREVRALESRKALRQEQVTKIRDLLAQNEEAMTQMDRTIVAIADMRTGNTQASMDMETAMLELERLAKRAQDYS